MNLLRENNKPESAEDVGKALIGVIEKNLDLRQWNFCLAFTKFEKTNDIKIIYDSEWLRLKFMFSRGNTPRYDELPILYSRLHAPNEKPFMLWNGQECICWHHIIDPLRFLDGLSPSEAVEQAKIQKQLPVIVRDYRQSDLGQKLFAKYPPESTIMLHSVIWKHYGLRLFELFDLRRPDLWEEYRKFIKEYHRLMDTKPFSGPPKENIC